MKVYVIETSGPFGNSALRVVSESFIERREWQLVKTKSGKKLLVDDKGTVEAIVIDEVADENAPKLAEEEGRVGRYL